MTKADATRAASQGDCYAQNNLDYVFQTTNGWMQNKVGYTIGQYCELFSFSLMTLLTDTSQPQQLLTDILKCIGLDVRWCFVSRSAIGHMTNRFCCFSYHLELLLLLRIPYYLCCRLSVARMSSLLTIRPPSQNNQHRKTQHRDVVYITRARSSYA